MADENNLELSKGQDAPEPIKLDCEVHSSESTPPDAVFKDDPSFFPELKLEILRAQAEVWGEDHIQIERIILYREVYDPPYLLSVEFRDYETLEKEKKFWPWQPDGLESLLEPDYKPAFGDLKNWIIYPRAPGEEIIDVRENCRWLLYTRNPEIFSDRIPIEPQGRAEIEKLQSERESDEEYKTKEYMLLRSKFREDHIEGTQLIDRWDLYEHELSNCLIIGLQGYIVDISSGGLVEAVSTMTVTSRMRQEARDFFQKRLGAKPARYPLKFQADLNEKNQDAEEEVKKDEYPRGGTVGSPFRPIPFQFVAGEVWEFETEEDVSKVHMRLLFRRRDVLRFERDYGLHEGGDDSAFEPRQPTSGPVSEESEGMKERIGSEGKALKEKNRHWTHDDIATEITSNEEIRERLHCEHLTKETVKRYLRGQGIGRKGRPTETNE